MTQNEFLSVIDAARELGKRKATIFKIMARLGINGVKRRDVLRGNQVASYITRDECERIRNELNPCDTGSRPADGDAKDNGFYSAEIGVFYLIQLEPNHDPQRFKVGFAANMADRLRSLRCSAPFSKVLKSWPCRRLWEKTAIDCVCAGCEQVHTEVFRAASIDEVMARCDRFFNMMPGLGENEQKVPKP